jgi:putative nucleotidyltransferase with HDIG domain
MIKCIRPDQLKPGMFVHDLNCGWMDHPFVFSRFAVTDEQTIKKIAAEGIKSLYIDTAKGMDVDGAPTQAEFDGKMHEKLVESVTGHTASTPRLDPQTVAAASLHEEVARARVIHSEANQVVHGIMNDVRLGKQIQAEKIEPMVERIAESVFRNPGALTSLSRIKEKDDYTFQHSVSVCTLLIAFCRAMDYEADVIMEAGMGGLLHDIGKMKVPNAILNKPSQLIDNEFEVMKSHAALGRDLLRGTSGVPESVILITGQHHERYDGSGYPDHLHEDKITVLGQMASIVDVYDALTSNRVYHSGMEPTAALRKLYEWSNHHFDLGLVNRFIHAIGIYPVGSLVLLESDKIAVVIQPGKENLMHPVVRVVFDRKKNQRVTPFDVDLSKPDGHGGGNHIVRHEEPHKWGLNPFDYF